MTLDQRPQHQRSELPFALAVTAVYAAYVFFVIFHHEPWRDEAHVWLAVRDMSPGQLIPWLGSSGTPGLWYLIVMPLAKGGLPYLSMFVVHGALAVALAFVVAYAAPFPRVFRCLIIFSYLFVYEYAVVARNYVLTGLAVVLIAMVLSAPKRRPLLLGVLLLLLANANPHGFFLSCIITSGLFIEAARRREFPRATLLMLGIAGVGILLAFWQLLPPPHAQNLTHPANWRVVNQALSRAFFPHIPPTARLPERFAAYPFIAFALYAARIVLVGWILIGTLLCIRRSPFCVYVLVLSLVALFYVFLFRWFQGERHAGLILLMVVFVTWVARATRAQNSIPEESHFDCAVGNLTRRALVIALAVSCGTAVAWAYSDVRYPFSLSKQMAMHLRDARLEGKVIASFPDSYGGPVLPYLPRSTRFWMVGRQEFGSYMVWDENWITNLLLPQEEVLRRCERQFPDRRFLLLDTRRLQDAEAHGYHLIYHTSAPYWMVQDEEYFLYEPIIPKAERPLQQSQSASVVN